jgi:hypothetical protein
MAATSIGPAIGIDVLGLDHTALDIAELTHPTPVLLQIALRVELFVIPIVFGFSE